MEVRIHNIAILGSINTGKELYSNVFGGGDSGVHPTAPSSSPLAGYNILVRSISQM